MDHDRFRRMGGVQKYGYGCQGWERARQELGSRKKSMMYQKIGIGFLVVALLGAVILIVTR